MVKLLVSGYRYFDDVSEISSAMLTIIDRFERRKDADLNHTIIMGNYRGVDKVAKHWRGTGKLMS